MSNKKIVAVIPARMAASRFPGKPLVSISGLPMIEHVRRRVSLCELLEGVYVATCDQEIADCVKKFGGNAIMTKNTHERCTDRVEEAALHLDCDIVVIVQGDEPLFTPDIIEPLVKPLIENEELVCANVLSPIRDREDLLDVNIIKTLIDQKNRVLYYSRAPIPYFRVKNNCPVYRQTGLSAFTKKFLHQFSQLPPTPLEVAESIDFLRILEHRFPIQGVICGQRTIGVDQPQDVGKIETVLLENPLHKEFHQKILHL